MIIYWKIFYADTADHKSHERSVYLNTNELSQVDKILIKIALKKQELFNNSKLFIPLRKRFITLKHGEEIPFSEDNDSFTCVMNLYSIYREDQDENEIDYSQFLSILRGENITLHSDYSCLYNRSIPEADLNRLIVWDNHPLKKEDFIFSTEDIEVLKQFCMDAKELQNTNFLGHDSYPSFHFYEKANRPYEVDYKIDQSEKDAAYVIFRRLIMKKEIACFFKAKDIILDEQKNKHKSFDVLCAKGEKINKLWTEPGEEIFFAKGLIHNIPELSNICWGEFIYAVLHHGRFHQVACKKIRDKYKEYESIINDKKTFDALFYIGVHEIARLVCNFASYVEDILYCLGEEIKIVNSNRRPIAIQDDFEKFVTGKAGELAFCLSKNDSKINYEKALQQAMEILQETFKGKLLA